MSSELSILRDLFCSANPLSNTQTKILGLENASKTGPFSVCFKSRTLFVHFARSHFLMHD